MNFQELSNSSDYLSGKLFSDAYKFYLGVNNPDIDRISLISEICSGKKVIHVGCVDHLNLLDQKILNNIWLHKRLNDVAIKCIGIDINESGIHELKNRGFKNVHFHDVMCSSLDVFEGESWDVMVLGEMLEHIDNPILFLQKIKERFNGVLGEVLISVPNATSYDLIKSLFKGYEFINSDHRYWYTPFTIAKALAVAGYVPSGYQYCNSYPREKISLSTILCSSFSFLRDTVVITARL